jgi:hypothetical protein
MRASNNGTDEAAAAQPRGGRALNQQNARSLFECVNEAALAQAEGLLRAWLPNGRLQGDEYLALNPKRDDRRLGSFRVNIRTGRWADFAIDVRGGDLISLAAYLGDCSQSEAARRMAAKLGTGRW